MAVAGSAAQRVTVPRSWVCTAVCEQGLHDANMAFVGSDEQSGAIARGWVRAAVFKQG
jgi:hypothetical protein